VRWGKRKCAAMWAGFLFGAEGKMSNTIAWGFVHER
jgi:hypothetical protein